MFASTTAGPATARENPLASVTVACEDFEESTKLVAVTVTLAETGMTDGAVYRPAASTVPAAAFPPAAPLTLQETPVFAVPATVALKDCVPPSGTDADAGASDTLTPGGGGGCGEPEPTTPPQPWSDAKSNHAKRHSDGVCVRELRSRVVALSCIRAGICTQCASAEQGALGCTHGAFTGLVRDGAFRARGDAYRIGKGAQGA